MGNIGELVPKPGLKVFLLALEGLCMDFAKFLFHVPVHHVRLGTHQRHALLALSLHYYSRFVPILIALTPLLKEEVEQLSVLVADWLEA